MNPKVYTQQGTYFQFPLCALSFGATVADRLNAIISFGLVEAGRVLWRRISDAQREQFVAQWCGPDGMSGFDRNNTLHLALRCGAHIIGVTLGSLRRDLAEYEALRTYRASFESRFGPDPEVRLKRQLVFEARDGTGITPRQLFILAAIYSIVGRKSKPVLITRERIRQRMLGYKTAAAFHAEHPRRRDGARPLSEWVLRSEILRLHARGFFQRCTFGQRQTYYSIRQTPSMFQNSLIELKTRSFAFSRMRRLNDDEITDTIRNQRAAMAGKRPPVPHAGPLVLRGGLVAGDTPFN